MRISSAVRRAGVWCEGALVTAALVYSIGMLKTTRVYANSCTPADCADLEEGANGLCEAYGYGSAVSVACPVTGNPDEAAIYCEYGVIEGPCDN
jgi:hypothetical protein